MLKSLYKLDKLYKDLYIGVKTMITNDMKIGLAQNLGSIQVWPLHWEGLRMHSFKTPPFLDAIKFNEFDEGDGPTINRIEVENPTTTPLMIPSGWIVGANLLQVRTVDSTEFIPAKSTSVINVSCVEKGRWESGSTDVDGGRAPISVMAAGWDFHGSDGYWRINLDNRQTRVWSQVSRQETRSGMRSTSSLKQIMEEDLHLDNLQASISEMCDERLLFHPNQNGILISTDGAPIFAEFFANPSGLKRTLRRTISSVSFDLQCNNPDSTSQNQVLMFLEEIRRTNFLSHIPTTWGAQLRGGNENVDTCMVVNQDDQILNLTTINRSHRLLQGV